MGQNYIAVDTSGNVYGGSNGVIDNITPAGVSSVFANVGSGRIQGLAFDGSGNLFVDINGNQGYIDKITPGGGVSTFALTQGNSDWGVAFDGSGNPYVSDYNGQQIEKFTPKGAASFIPTQSRPLGLAGDPAGNLYVGESVGLVKITPAGAASTLIPAGYESHYEVALSPSNNVYVAGYNYKSTIREYSADGRVSTFDPHSDNVTYVAFTPAPSPSRPAWSCSASVPSAWSEFSDVVGEASRRSVADQIRWVGRAAQRAG